MDLNNCAVLVSIAGLAGAFLLQLRELSRCQRSLDCAFDRLAIAERRAADAEANLARADAIAASLWLHVEPDLAHVYHRAVGIFGKVEVDRNIREAVQRGEWKIPGTN